MTTLKEPTYGFRFGLGRKGFGFWANPRGPNGRIIGNLFRIRRAGG